MWKTPRKKPFKPEGITLGATVTGLGKYLEWQSAAIITGQIWSAARPDGRKRRWFVVTSDGYAYLCNEADLTVLRQCVDTPITQTNVA